MKARKKKKPFDTAIRQDRRYTERRVLKKWGNSILDTNIKFWKCFYCGNLIKDRIPFSILKINGDSEPHVFCSYECLKIYIIKKEAERTD